MIFASSFLLLSVVYAIGAVDQHENCEYWASLGECDANPGYMLESCAQACSKVVSDAVNIPESFYSIEERDIEGNVISFERFRGKVVYIVNVASQVCDDDFSMYIDKVYIQCGYTKENYDILRDLSSIRSDSFEMLIFPCNQFGAQEPGDSMQISEFARGRGYSGIIMEKGDVNGVNARPTFKFLKSRSAKKAINWNFEGKFIVDPSGNVRLLTGNVVEIVRNMLAQRDL